MTESPYENEFYTFKGTHCGHAEDVDWTIEQWNGTTWGENWWKCEATDADTFTGHVNKNGIPLTSSKGPMDIILTDDIKKNWSRKSK